MLLKKIPPALLAKRFGGGSTAHEMRKTVFFHEGPRYLKQLAAEILSAGHAGTLQVQGGSLRESGVAAIFESPQLTLALYEDALLQNGLQLLYHLRAIDGTLLMTGLLSVDQFEKKARLAILVRDMQAALRSAPQQMNLH